MYTAFHDWLGCCIIPLPPFWAEGDFVYGGGLTTFPAYCRLSTMKTSDRVADLLNKGLTVLEVAHELGISPQAVYKHIHKHDLTIRKRPVNRTP